MTDVVGSRTKIVVIATLIAVMLATVVGAVLYWPDRDALAAISAKGTFDAQGVTYESARIESITDGCAGQGQAPNQFVCETMTVRLTSGVDEGQTVELNVVGPPTQSGLGPGDRVEVMRNPAQGQVIYSLSGINRGLAVIVMGLIFVVTVLAVAGKKGFWALIGLAFAFAVVITYMLPALASGRPGMMVGLVGSSLIMFVTIYIAHGFSMRSSAALLGTMLGLVISTGLGIMAVWMGHLSGLMSEEEMSLAARVDGLNFRQLLIAAMIVAGLGVLNDVTITQASSVWELRAAAPQMSRREIFTAGMRIGRDHIASTIYTIVFAYAGAALSTMLLLTLFYHRPAWDLLSTEMFGSEVLRTLASSTGLVLAVPITTAIAALTIRGAEPEVSHYDYAIHASDDVAPLPHRARRGDASWD